MVTTIPFSELLQQLSSDDVLFVLLIASLATLLTRVISKMVGRTSSRKTMSSVEEIFPTAVTNEELVNTIKQSLADCGFTEDTLVATSLCCDEVNRPLERDLDGLFGDHFNMGGLAGVPFGGVTAFGAMAHHIPDGGNCLIVHGPHVGVDSKGRVGTVERRGREKGGSCCGSAIAAANYVQDVLAGQKKKTGCPKDAYDAEQTFVGNMLLPHGERLRQAADPMAVLPYALYEVQKEIISDIVAKGCKNVEGDGKIAVLGGIQINTPHGISDYFLPLRFDVFDNSGKLFKTILQGPSLATASKIMAVFPKALPNAELTSRVKESLQDFEYDKSSLLCTSLCCDEVNRPLELELQREFGDHFNIGGLAGFAFGGATGFGAMAHHIPDGGSCLIVYGPHVGVDSDGHVGTVNRRGRVNGGACCGSGVAAAAYVKDVMNGQKKPDAPIDPVDAQQSYVGNMLLPYGEQLQKAKDLNVALPHALYQAQDKMMQQIVGAGCSHVPENGKITLLGGIMINTPDDLSDYFLPLRFEVLDNKGHVLSDCLSALGKF